MENVSSLFERFNDWVKESIVVKLMSIGFLILILMIPSLWVQNIIYERQSRADEVIKEVSGKWAAKQTITGPVLMVPYKEITKVDEWSGGVKYTRLVEEIHRGYFIPDDLNINGTITPEALHRGIFDVAVYDSKISIKSVFGDLNFQKWGVADENVLWSDAELQFGINDLQGIHENPKITADGKSLVSESSANIGFKNGEANLTGIIVPFDWKSREDVLKNVDIELALKGSEQLYFTPIGKTTTVTLAGEWGSPSFDGKMLPTTKELNDDNFKATWQVLSFNRAIADQWVNANQPLSGTEFGVRFLIPADQYQKSMRTAKYDALIIILAFTALFLVEITRKVRIHPFQYILVGVALTVYYTLLLSISEHLGYNAAYAIASAATVLLLALYSITFLKLRGLVVFFSSVMSIFYVFIFVIIQAEDYSLLIGSVGLFVITAVVMYFSRNIKWYKEKPEVLDAAEAS
ncbi:MAG: cell envelope integrity protein CreD [Bacteroidota bacterium]